MQFLVTIDDDKDPSNGIKITPAIQAAAVSLSANFTLSGFDTDSNISLVIGTLTEASTTGIQVLISDLTAQSHLSGSLFTTMAGNYSGTYSGTDSGTWTIAVAIDGTVTGSSNSNSNAIGSSAVSGAVQSSGTTLVSGSGTSSGGSTWTGNINITNGAFSGTWSNLPDSGTFTGNKI